VKPSKKLSRAECLRWHSLVLVVIAALVAACLCLLLIIGVPVLSTGINIVFLFSLPVSRANEIATRVVLVLVVAPWLSFVCLSTLGVAAWARSIRSLIVVDCAALLATPVFLWGVWNALFWLEP
jgi:hypothetical protein